MIHSLTAQCQDGPEISQEEALAVLQRVLVQIERIETLNQAEVRRG